MTASGRRQRAWSMPPQETHGLPGAGWKGYDKQLEEWLSVDDSFVENWQEEETVLPSGGD
jgi:hypothetical protein